jgi:hypothetical protein
MDSKNPKDIAAIKEKRIAFHTIPPVAKVLLALAMMEGAEKYGWFNWRKFPIDQKIYTDAAERHLTALQDGEWIDKESNLPHAVKVMACMAVILDSVYKSDTSYGPYPAANIIYNKGNIKSNEQ